MGRRIRRRSNRPSGCLRAFMARSWATRSWDLEDRRLFWQRLTVLAKRTAQWLWWSPYRLRISTESSLPCARNTGPRWPVWPCPVLEIRGWGEVRSVNALFGGREYGASRARCLYGERRAGAQRSQGRAGRGLVRRWWAIMGWTGVGAAAMEVGEFLSRNH